MRPLNVHGDIGRKASSKTHRSAQITLAFLQFSVQLSNSELGSWSLRYVQTVLALEYCTNVAVEMAGLTIEDMWGKAMESDRDGDRGSVETEWEALKVTEGQNWQSVRVEIRRSGEQKLCESEQPKNHDRTSFP